MADTWIESHSTLRNHPKLVRLAAKLKCSRVAAIGHLHCLWWWATDYAESGDLSGFSDEEIASGADWEKDSAVFRRIMTECGWIDADGHLHDWWQYAGKLAARRERKRSQMRAARGSNVPNCGGHVETTLPPRVDHVETTGGSHVEGYPTIPYPTIPYPTQPVRAPGVDNTDVARRILDRCSEFIAVARVGPTDRADIEFIAEVAGSEDAAVEWLRQAASGIDVRTRRPIRRPIQYARARAEREQAERAESANGSPKTIIESGVKEAVYD